MGNPDQKPRLIGPWRSMHAAIWMIGLGILALYGWWWPGILILVGISMAAEGLLMQIAPQAFDKTERSQPAPPALASSRQRPEEVQNPAQLLPATCPNCGGPLRGHEVKWTTSRSANCPYCGSNITLKPNR